MHLNIILPEFVKYISIEDFMINYLGISLKIDKVLTQLFL